MILRNLVDWINRKQYMLGQFFFFTIFPISSFLHVILWLLNTWPISALLTVLYLALTVVLCRESLQKQAVLLLTARIAWKLLAGWQTGFCGFSRSDIGCYRPPVIYSCGGKLQPPRWPRRHLGLNLSLLFTTTWGEVIPRWEPASSTCLQWEDQRKWPEAETRENCIRY